MRRPYVHHLTQNAAVRSQVRRILGRYIQEPAIEVEQSGDRIFNGVASRIRHYEVVAFAIQRPGLPKLRERERGNNIRTLEQFWMIANLTTMTMLTAF